MRNYSTDLLFFASYEVLLHMTIRELNSLDLGELKRRAIDLLDYAAEEIASMDSESSDVLVSPESISEERIRVYIPLLED